MKFRIALCLLSVLMCAEVAMGQSAPAEKTGAAGALRHQK